MAGRKIKDGTPIGMTTDKRGRPMLVLDSGMRRYIRKEEVDEWQRRLDSSGASSTPAPRRRAKNTPVRHARKQEIDHKPRDLGWILRGFVEGARGQGKAPDPADIFEPPEEKDELRSAHDDHLELGRELHELLPAMIIHFNISAEEWMRWFDRADSENEFRSKDPLGGSIVSQRSTFAGGWLPPVQGPISSRFGAKRGQGRSHEGVDIAVPTGTPIFAPEDMEITEVGFGERAGRFVIGEVSRSDGSYFNDDRWRLTFAHLSEVKVADGQRVRRGDVIGLSGATGAVTGPHLHLRMQWVNDVAGPIDDVYAVDPLAVIPEQAFVTGQPIQAPGGPAQALKQGDRVNVIVAPGAGRINVQGHGLPQADIDVQVPVGGASGGVSSSSARGGDPLAGQNVQQASFLPQLPGSSGDPIADIAGIATTVLDVAGAAARVAGPVLQAGGAAAQVGGAITSAVGFPQVGAPVAVVGKVASVAGGAAGVAGGFADPISDLVEGVMGAGETASPAGELVSSDDEVLSA